jgi:hypothetical protein
VPLNADCALAALVHDVGQVADELDAFVQVHATPSPSTFDPPRATHRTS